MFEHLRTLQETMQEYEERLADPALISDMNEWRKINREYVNRKPLAEASKEYFQALDQLEEDRMMLEEAEDEELIELLKEEIVSLQNKTQELEQEIRILLLPKDPNDHKNVIVEIRGGAGGDEAGLFAGDLVRMYHMYADKLGYQVEEISTQDQELLSLVRMKRAS